MLFRLLLVCYCAGLLFGSLAAIEWLVVRIVRLWLSGVVAGLAACALAAAFAGIVKMRRLIAR
jgi:hypothetical protein